MEPEANAETMGKLASITNVIDWPSMANASLAIVDTSADVASVSWCWPIPSMEFNISRGTFPEDSPAVDVKSSIAKPQKSWLMHWISQAKNGRVGINYQYHRVTDGLANSQLKSIGIDIN